MKLAILNLACIFTIIFVLIFGWEMWKTPRVYFNVYSHPILRLKPVTEVKEDIVALITRKSLEHGLDPLKTVRIARCESGLRPEAKNKYSSARGLYQITIPTELEAERNLKRKFDAYNPEDNIEMAFYFFKKNQWRRWLCK